MRFDKLAEGKAQSRTSVYGFYRRTGTFVPAGNSTLGPWLTFQAEALASQRSRCKLKLAPAALQTYLNTYLPTSSFLGNPLNQQPYRTRPDHRRRWGTVLTLSSITLPFHSSETAVTSILSSFLSPPPRANTLRRALKLSRSPAHVNHGSRSETHRG